jgi:L-fuconolactonase
MIGSDWPVCRLAGEYREVMEIPKLYFKELDPVKKDRILRKNALEFYKLS